jgi:hypothetical protein
MKYYSVYEMVVDRKKYIGCTGQSISTRMAKHRYDARYDKLPVHKALNKAGLFNATVKILSKTVNRDKALATEARLIKQNKPQLNVYLK